MTAAQERQAAGGPRPGQVAPVLEAARQARPACAKAAPGPHHCGQGGIMAGTVNMARQQRVTSPWGLPGAGNEIDDVRHCAPVLRRGGGQAKLPFFS